MKKKYDKNNLFPGLKLGNFKLEKGTVSALVFEHKSGCPKPEGGKCTCTPKAEILSADEFLERGI